MVYVYVNVLIFLTIMGSTWQWRLEMSSLFIVIAFVYCSVLVQTQVGDFAFDIFFFIVLKSSNVANDNYKLQVFFTPCSN